MGDGRTRIAEPLRQPRLFVSHTWSHICFMLRRSRLITTRQNMLNIRKTRITNWPSDPQSLYSKSVRLRIYPIFNFQGLILSINYGILLGPFFREQFWEWVQQGWARCSFERNKCSVAASPPKWNLTRIVPVKLLTTQGTDTDTLLNCCPPIV